MILRSTASIHQPHQSLHQTQQQTDRTDPHSLCLWSHWFAEQELNKHTPNNVLQPKPNACHCRRCVYTPIALPVQNATVSSLSIRNQPHRMFSIQSAAAADSSNYDFTKEENAAKWQGLFVASLRRVLEQLHPSLNAGDDALLYVESLCLHLLGLLCAKPSPHSINVSTGGFDQSGVYDWPMFDVYLFSCHSANRTLPNVWAKHFRIRSRTGPWRKHMTPLTNRKNQRNLCCLSKRFTVCCAR